MQVESISLLHSVDAEATALFSSLDSNGDGVLDRAEFEAAVQSGSIPTGLFGPGTAPSPDRVRARAAKAAQDQAARAARRSSDNKPKASGRPTASSSRVCLLRDSGLKPLMVCMHRSCLVTRHRRE